MIADLLYTVFQQIQGFIEWLFNAIFGDWYWQVLFGWLPADFLQYCTFLILFFFALAIIKFIKGLIPFF